MVNIIWFSLISIGIFYSIFTNNIESINTTIIDSTKISLDMLLKIFPVIALWMGLTKIAEKSELLKKLSLMISPLLTKIFPDIPEGHPSLSLIASNIIANLFGLGSAATPFGLKAMKELAVLNPEPDKSRASTDMCTFLIINIASLQLIPVNIIAYRSQYGSVNPTATLVAGIIATFLSVLSGVLFSVFARKLSKRKKRAV